MLKNINFEPVTHQIKSSSIKLTEEELTITISRDFWNNRHWNKLVSFIFQIAMNGLTWVMGPFAPSVFSSTQDMPHWKQITVDGISYLLFALLIRSDHFLHKLFKAIDWNKIDERCAVVYRNQKGGAPAYPPQVLFRILVLMFVSGTPFESATLVRLETDISWRWFAGLSVLNRIPDAGTLSYFRSRLGPELFEEILTDLIIVCDKAGLIDHKQSYYDMTGVEGSATQVTPYQRAVILTKAISAWLDDKRGSISREQIAGIALEVLQEKHSSLKKISPKQIASGDGKSEKKSEETEEEKEDKSPDWWQGLTEKISELKQNAVEKTEVTAEELRQVAQELVPELPQAFGDPDATVGHTRTDGTVCGYRSGFLVDAKRFIITAVVFVTLSKPEAPTLITALDKYYAIFGKYPDQVGADSAFDRDGVHVKTEACKIFFSATVRSRPGPSGIFRADSFVWNEEGKLMCPGGAEMKKVGGPYKNGSDRYQSEGMCEQCPLFEQCLTEKQREKGKSRRELQTDTAAHQRAQRHRKRSNSPEGKKIRRHRFASEGVFGHVNQFHNGDKAPYRNEAMNNIAQLMVAFVYNLEKLARYG